MWIIPYCTITLSLLSLTRKRREDGRCGRDLPRHEQPGTQASLVACCTTPIASKVGQTCRHAFDDFWSTNEDQEGGSEQEDMLHIIFFGKLKQHDLFHLDRQSYTTKKIGLNIGFPANQLANRQASFGKFGKGKGLVCYCWWKKSG